MKKIKASATLPNFIGSDAIEGFRSHPYLDSAGKATIGCGTRFYPHNGTYVKLTDPPITKEQAFNYLQKSMQIAIDFLP